MVNASSKSLVFERLGARLREEFEPPFAREEYERRWRLVREEMSRRGIDLLWVSTPEDMAYLTGQSGAWYHDLGPDAWDPVAAVAIHCGFDVPIVFDDEDESLLARHVACSPDLRIAPNDFTGWITTGTQAAEDAGAFAGAMEFMVQTLRNEGWLPSRVGLQLGSYRPSRRYSEAFEAALRQHGATITDGTNVVATVRRYKSAPELEAIREAARIGDLGMRALIDGVAAGVSELELWAAATSAMAAAGGELSAIPGMVNSGPKNASLHGSATRRKLRHGDLINVDMCGVYNRYHSNLARCISLGEPSASVRAAIDRVTDVHRQVRAAMYPGMPIAELLAVNESAARAAGIWQDAWWVGGYDLGIAFAPDWVGRFDFSAGEDPGEAALEPGLVMNHEWNYYLPDGAGIRELIDTFIVTPTGIEFPHTVPAELIVAREGHAQADTA